MSPSRFGSGRRVQVNQSGGRYRAENSSRTSAPYSLVSLHPPPKPSTSRARPRRRHNTKKWPLEEDEVAQGRQREHHVPVTVSKV